MRKKGQGKKGAEKGKGKRECLKGEEKRREKRMWGEKKE